MKRTSAFTLAEVLITLGIIGVVAAMTIPTLMQNTGKAELKTAYKKILSAVNQAATMSVALDYIDFGDATAGVNDGSLYKILTDRMHVIKAVGPDIVENVGAEADLGKMFADPATVATNNITLFFSDGMVISFPKDTKNCTSSAYRYKDGTCRAIVDVNGLKKPNKLSNCQWNASSGSTPSATTDDKLATGDATCNEENLYISDQYSVIFKGQQLVPNGYAAKYVLYQK